jgi:type II secretory pathway component PulM
MSVWWRARSAREKWLIGLAAALLAGALWWQLLVMPAAARGAEAGLAYDRAVQTLERLDRIARMQAEGANLRAAGPGGDPEAIRRALISRASDAGLMIGDVRRPAPGRLQADITAAEPAAIFAWTLALEAEEGLSVSSASFTPAGGGRVNALIDVVAGGAP